MIRGLIGSILVLCVASGPARAQPAEPKRAEPNRAEPKRAEPRVDRRTAAVPTRRRHLRMRTDERSAPTEDLGKEDAVPPLDTDPFRPPKGQERARPAKTAKHLPWFARPSVLFVARFSKNRSYMPKEGFGFGVQVGVSLGRSTLRLALAVAYHFYRLARTLDIVVNDANLTSCTAIRTLGYHLATGSAQGVAYFSKVQVWAGLRGGFAHAQLQTPTSTCGTDSASQSTGVLGPELGVGYGLRPDLHIGVSAAYLHFFSDKVYTAADSGTHRYFYGMLTVGAALTLRF